MRRFIALFAVFALLRASTAWAAYFPEPIPVVGGGTGLATLTAHALIVGEGTGNVALVGPGSTAGVPLVSGGSSADPSFTTAVVAGGGTGLGTLTAHNVMLGEGTGNVAFAAPGATVGVPLISQNATTDPVFGTAVVAGGGTGVATLAANGVVVGEGTSAVHVVGTSSTADSFLAWAAAGADPAALSVPNCADTTGQHLNYTTAAHTITCGTSGTAPQWTWTDYTSNTTPVTLASTNFLYESIAQGTPAALTVQLPATPADKLYQCVKDRANTAATNNITVKTTDSATIDSGSGATGVVMNITKSALCFLFQASIGANGNWSVN